MDAPHHVSEPSQPRAQIAVDAVLFDLDGTLVDASGAVERAWRAAARDLGVSFAILEPYMHGIPAAQALDAAMPGLPPAQRDWIAEQMLISESNDNAGVAATPGALELLHALPASRVGIVTSGFRQVALSRMKAAGLPEPGALVTANDVAIGKPDPAPFLLGARRLGQTPARCLAVEDSPAGVRSAAAAAMQVLGLRTTYRDLDGVTWIIDDLSLLRPLKVGRELVFEICLRAEPSR